MMFGKSLTALAMVSMIILGVGSASADTIITAGVSNTGTDNVLFNVGGLDNDALTVEGIVNDGAHTLVEFDGTETLHSNGGQARVEAFTGGYNSLLVSLPGNTFTKLVMNLNTLGGGSGFVSFFLNGVDFGSPFAIGNGSNFFTIEGVNGTAFSTVQFLTTVDLLDTRQIRIGGVAPAAETTGTPVPEPSTWAMTLVGLAALGLRARARRTN